MFQDWNQDNSVHDFHRLQLIVSMEKSQIKDDLFQISSRNISKYLGKLSL